MKSDPEFNKIAETLCQSPEGGDASGLGILLSVSIAECGKPNVFQYRV